MTDAAVPAPIPRSVVFDTNVFISALLGPGRGPDRLLSMLVARRIPVSYDARIQAEYESVSARPKFRRVPSERRTTLLGQLLGLGTPLLDVQPFVGALADESDRIFIEAALAGRAAFLITGNLKDYAQDLGFTVLTPASALVELAGHPRSPT